MLCPSQIGRLLLPVPTPKRVMMGARLLLGASAIIVPIIRAEVCAGRLSGLREYMTSDAQVPSPQGIRAVFFPSLVAIKR
jgi:hypothetical protein